MASIGHLFVVAPTSSGSDQQPELDAAQFTGSEPLQKKQRLEQRHEQLEKMKRLSGVRTDKFAEGVAIGLDETELSDPDQASVCRTIAGRYFLVGRIGGSPVYLPDELSQHHTNCRKTIHRSSTLVAY